MWNNCVFSKVVDSYCTRCMSSNSSSCKLTPFVFVVLVVVALCATFEKMQCNMAKKKVMMMLKSKKMNVWLNAKNQFMNGFCLLACMCLSGWAFSVCFVSLFLCELRMRAKKKSACDEYVIALLSSQLVRGHHVILCSMCIIAFNLSHTFTQPSFKKKERKKERALQFL